MKEIIILIFLFMASFFLGVIFMWSFKEPKNNINIGFNFKEIVGADNCTIRIIENKCFIDMYNGTNRITTLFFPQI